MLNADNRNNKSFVTDMSRGALSRSFLYFLGIIIMIVVNISGCKNLKSTTFTRELEFLSSRIGTYELQLIVPQIVSYLLSSIYDYLFNNDFKF